MAHSIVVDTDHWLVLSKFWGIFDAADFEQYLLAMEREGPFEEPFRLLLIFHTATQFDISADAIRTGARRPPQFADGAQRVIVAQGAVAFGLSRLYSMESPLQSDDYAVFNTIEAACGLLDLYPENLDLSFPEHRA
jgi:hypothetical protein